MPHSETVQPLSACVLTLIALTAVTLLARLHGETSKVEVASAVVLLVGMVLAVVSL